MTPVAVAAEARALAAGRAAGRSMISTAFCEEDAGWGVGQVLGMVEADVGWPAEVSTLERGRIVWMIVWGGEEAADAEVAVIGGGGGRAGVRATGVAAAGAAEVVRDARRLVALRAEEGTEILSPLAEAGWAVVAAVEVWDGGDLGWVVPRVLGRGTPPDRGMTGVLAGAASEDGSVTTGGATVPVAGGSMRVRPKNGSIAPEVGVVD